MIPPHAIVSGAFDDVRSPHIRFLEAATAFGAVTALVWPDDVVEQFNGRPPKFPLAERLYVLNALRYVSRAVPCHGLIDPCTLPDSVVSEPVVWVDTGNPDNGKRLEFCEARGLNYRIISDRTPDGFPDPVPAASAPGRKKVVVTGCYDWFHSGHVRFFEEVSAYGDLHVIVGHDANIRLLKGEKHPLLPQAERRYMVASVKYVKEALISSGDGWLDADPEIRRLMPDIYAVNEDGDKGGKREYCAKLGIEYLILRRAPAPGLPPRHSTNLRGF